MMNTIEPKPEKNETKYSHAIRQRAGRLVLPEDSGRYTIFWRSRKAGGLTSGTDQFHTYPTFKLSAFPVIKPKPKHCEHA